MGTDMSELLTELTRVEPEKGKLWRWLFVMNVLHRPWPDGIAIFEDMLAERTDEDAQALFGPIVLKFGELPGQAATDFLIRQLRHPWPAIRAFACLAFISRRSRRALSTLLDLAATEANAGAARQLLAGIRNRGYSVKFTGENRA